MNARSSYSENDVSFRSSRKHEKSDEIWCCILDCKCVVNRTLLSHETISVGKLIKLQIHT